MLTDRLKKTIQNSGLSLSRFAQLTGVAKNTLINYRDGVTSLRRSFSRLFAGNFPSNPGGC